MLVWSFLNQKGGSGKTTLLLNVSVAAMQAGLGVSVLDADPQYSSEKWRELRQTLRPKTVGYPAVSPAMASDIEGMLAEARKQKTDLTLIDTAGATNRIMLTSAYHSHLVVIPTRLDLVDEHSLSDTLKYLQEANHLRKAVLVLNGTIKDRSGLPGIELTARKYKVPILKTELRQSAELAKAFRDGRGITEYSARSAAASDIRGIYDELMAVSQKIGRRGA